MSARQPQIISQDVTADTEKEVTIPAEIVDFEVQIMLTEDGSGTDADGRMAFESGETADGGKHVYIDPDYWPNEKIRLPINTKLYLRSAINNTFKILYWEGQ